MIRFLRTFRQRLLIEYRYSRYLLYAVGEIILVVIGILIAIAVDNWNEEQVRRTKIDQILMEMLIDLENNIDGIDNHLANYQIADSLSYRVLNRQLTLEDYLKKDNHPRLYSILNRYEVSSIGQNAENKLKTYLENFPSEYGDILKHLDSLGPFAAGVEVNNSNMMEFANRYLYYLTENYAWYGENIEPAENMAYLNYLLHDSYYTNMIRTYRVFAFGNHAVNMILYKFFAVSCYYEIAKQLGLADRAGRFNVEAAISDVFLGRWKSADGGTGLEYSLGYDGLLQKTTTTKTTLDKDRVLDILSYKALQDGYMIRTGSWNKDYFISYTTEVIHHDTLRIFTNSREDIFYRAD